MENEPMSASENEDAITPEREPPPILWLPVGLIGLLGVFNLLWAVIVYGFMKQRWGDAFMYGLTESAFALILAGALGSGQKVSYWLAMAYVGFYAYRDWSQAQKCSLAGHIFMQDVEYIYSAVNAVFLIALLGTLILPPVIAWFYPRKV